MKTCSIVLFVLALTACAATRPSSDTAPSSSRGVQTTIEKPSKLEVVPLKYASADEVAASLTKLLDDGGPSTIHAVDASGVGLEPSDRIQVVADVRTNSLLIRCPADRADEMPDLLAAIARLDQKVTKE